MTTQYYANLLDEFRPLLAKAHHRRLQIQARHNLALARDHQNRQAEAIALMALSAARAYTGRYHEARLLIDGALDIARRLDVQPFICDVLCERGDLLITGSAQPYEAREDFQEAILIAQQCDYSHGINLALIGLSRVYNYIENHAEAGKFAQAALDHARDNDDDLLQCQALIQLGRAASGQDKRLDAMEALHDALQLAHERHFLTEQALIIHDGGLVLLKNNQYKEAIEHQTHALSVSDKLGFVYGEFMALYGLGIAHMTAGNYDLGRDAFDAMMLLAERTETPMYQASASVNLGRLHHTLGEHHIAQDYFIRALDLSRRFNNPTHESIALLWLATCQTALHDYTAARDYYDQARRVNESLNNDSRVRRISFAIIWTYFEEALHRLLRLVGLRRPDSSGTPP